MKDYGIWKSVWKMVGLLMFYTDYFIDMLFYHLKLRCYVVIELKIGEFKPEYAGKMNFYINAVNNILKTDKDNDTIGLILCKGKNRLTVEYSLNSVENPIGVSSFEILPKEIIEALPTEEDLNLHIDINEKDSEWYEILIMYRIFSTMLRKLELEREVFQYV